MPSYRKDVKRKKPWVARAKRDTVHYFLGYHATQEEALMAELRFNDRFPRKCAKTQSITR